MPNPLARILQKIFPKTSNYIRAKIEGRKASKSNTYNINSNNLQSSVSGENAEFKPPSQLYGVRIRQRRDFPCNDPALPQYMRLCENLKKEGRVVQCGDQRFR